MEVNVIVAVGKDGAIGKNGDLVWHIREDLKRFKSLTMGNPVIMGRKTWESLPKKPLPGRLNIVLSHNHGYVADGAVVVGTPEEALAKADTHDVFIIGGAHIYEAFMPLATKIYLTEIDSVCPDADAFLALPVDSEPWRVEEVSDPLTSSDGIVYKFVTYVKKQ